MSQKELGNPNSRTWKRLAAGQAEITDQERQRAEDAEARLAQAERALAAADVLAEAIEALDLRLFEPPKPTELKRKAAAYRTARRGE